MKNFILYFVLFLICDFSFAQQLPQFTSYQLSPFLYNPAYAGVDETTQLNAVIRSQWDGVREAPQSDVLSGFHKIKVCIGYEYMGANIKYSSLKIKPLGDTLLIM